MKKFTLIVVAVVIALLVAGAVFLATSNIAAPTAKIEHPIPDEKMPK